MKRRKGEAPGYVNSAADGGGASSGSNNIKAAEPKQSCCRICGKPMKGHKKAECKGATRARSRSPPRENSSRGSALSTADPKQRCAYPIMKRRRGAAAKSGENSAADGGAASRACRRN